MAHRRFRRRAPRRCRPRRQVLRAPPGGASFGFRRTVPHLLGIAGGFVVQLLNPWSCGGAPMFELSRESPVALVAHSRARQARHDRVDAANAPAIRFHERLGFTHAGTLREVGYKFDRWLDLLFLQRAI